MAGGVNAPGTGRGLRERAGRIRRTVEEYSGALTQGDTLDEARANLDNVVRLMIETSREMHAPQTGDGTLIREPLLITD
jgi:hypothetical protein